MAHNIRKSQKTKIQDTSAIFWEFRAENPFSEVPQSSCIVWDTQGPFLRHVYFFDFRPAGQKPTKICRNGYLFPFPWRKQPRGPCPSQRAPDLKVHSQIESSVRPNGTPVMPLLHFGQVRLSSDQAKLGFSTLGPSDAPNFCFVRPSDPRMHPTFGFSTLGPSNAPSF